MPDHNLRLLVGHANLLDSLMLELADAEREQESWFNQSVRNASQHEEKKKATTASENKHIQWADSIAEEDEEDDYDSSSSDDDSDLSSDDEDVEMADIEVVSLRRVPSNTTFKAPSSPKLEVVEVDMEDFEEDDYEDEDYADLTLTRTHSHHSLTSSSSSSPPPELEHDLDESSEDESMPPSPPSTMLPTFDEQAHQKQKGSESPIANSTDYYDDSIHYMPTTATTCNPAALVSAISVY